MEFTDLFFDKSERKKILLNTSEFVGNLEVSKEFNGTKLNCLIVDETGRMNEIVLASYSIKLYCPFG